MKKTIILLFIGSVLAGAGLLAGVAYAFGAIAESGVRKAAESKPPEDTEVAWQLDLGDYRRGFFSSETHSRFHIEDPLGDVEVKEEDGMPLRHVIYHGPVAMTPEGPKFCSYHIVTTLRIDKMDEKARESIPKAFKGANPLTIHTTTGFDGGQVTRLTVAPFTADEPETFGEITFSGATARLETGPDLAFARGEFTIGSLIGTAQGDTPMEMEISPSSGTLDYVEGTKLTATFKTGEMKGTSEDSLFTMAPSEGEIDWLKQDHFKAHLTVGKIEAGGRNVDAGSVIAGPGTLSMDYKRVSDRLSLLLGETKFHLEQVDIEMPGNQMSMKDFIIRADSGVKDGKLYGLINYEVGEIDAPEDPAAPLPFSQIAGKGVEVELGIAGFDLAAVESLAEKTEALPGLQRVAAMSDFSGPERSGKLAEAMAENSDAVKEISRGMMDLFQPGLEIYYETKVRGETGISSADIRVGMGGDKKLTDLATPRAMLMSLTGNANLRVSKSQYPAEDLRVMLGESGEPFIAEHPDRLEMIAELAEGKLFINGEANPLLDDLGPGFDEPFDWDAFIDGMAAGLAGPN